eukprot:6414743-Pyramimonas_sp.AAC.1
MVMLDNQPGNPTDPSAATTGYQFVGRIDPPAAHRAPSGNAAKTQWHAGGARRAGAGEGEERMDAERGDSLPGSGSDAHGAAMAAFSSHGIQVSRDNSRDNGV